MALERRRLGAVFGSQDAAESCAVDIALEIALGLGETSVELDGIRSRAAGRVRRVFASVVVDPQATNLSECAEDTGPQQFVPMAGWRHAQARSDHFPQFEAGQSGSIEQGDELRDRLHHLGDVAASTQILNSSHLEVVDRREGEHGPSIRLGAQHRRHESPIVAERAVTVRVLREVDEIGSDPSTRLSLEEAAPGWWATRS